MIFHVVARRFDKIDLIGIQRIEAMLALTNQKHGSAGFGLVIQPAVADRWFHIAPCSTIFDAKAGLLRESRAQPELSTWHIERVSQFHFKISSRIYSLPRTFLYSFRPTLALF